MYLPKKNLKMMKLLSESLQSCVIICMVNQLNPLVADSQGVPRKGFCTVQRAAALGPKPYCVSEGNPGQLKPFDIICSYYLFYNCQALNLE